MRSVLFFMLLNIYYATTKDSNPRSVNVALETSLLFQPGDENNISFINKLRRFIDQIEQAITPVKAYLRTTDENKNTSKVFSKFIEKITRSIIKYDDEDLKEVAKLVAKEADTILNTNEVFSEHTRNTIVDILKVYSRVNAKDIRVNLQNALDGKEIIVSRLADKINTFYNDNDKAKLGELIDKSDKLARDKSSNAKRDIKNMVNDFMNILKDKFNTLEGTAKTQLSIDIGTIFQYIDLSKTYFNDRNKNHELIKKLSRHQKNTTGHGNLKNTKDIILNKDIEIFVKSIKSSKDGKSNVNGNEKNNSQENRLEFNKLENQSLDLSTVLDDLNKS